MRIIIFISFIIVGILGVAFHFTHKTFKKGLLLHMFSAVNESVWEHMKLALSPMFFMSFVQFFLLSDEYTNIWFSALVATLFGIALIPLLYYPIRFILGREITFVSISLYFVAIAIAYYIQYLILKTGFTIIAENISFMGLLVLPPIFLFFTFYPPKLSIFTDPTNMKSGDIV